MPEWIEQLVTDDLFRVRGNPVVQVRPGGYDEDSVPTARCFRQRPLVMFYFGVEDGAHIIAFSRDLLRWTSHPDPLYRQAPS